MTEEDASVADDYPPTHPLADKMISPKWDTPGRCVCEAVLPQRSEWTDAHHQWANTTCEACGRYFVDEDEFFMIYDLDHPSHPRNDPDD